MLYSIMEDVGSVEGHKFCLPACIAPL